MSNFISKSLFSKDQSNPGHRAYYSLIVLNHGEYEIEFGDYDRASVEKESATWSKDDAYQSWIIETDHTQKAIVQGLAEFKTKQARKMPAFKIQRKPYSAERGILCISIHCTTQQGYKNLARLLFRENPHNAFLFSGEGTDSDHYIGGYEALYFMDKDLYKEFAADFKESKRKLKINYNRPISTFTGKTL